MNAKDEEIAKSSSEEGKEIESLKRQSKTLAIPEEQSNDEEKEDILESSSEERGKKIKVNIRKVLQREKKQQGCQTR